MKVNIRRLGLALLIIATIIPSYWFLAGRKILNLVYYITTVLFMVQLLLGRSRSEKMKCGAAGIYILSLFLYSLQAFWDAGSATAINSAVSTAMVVIIV